MAAVEEKNSEKRFARPTTLVATEDSLVLLDPLRSARHRATALDSDGSRGREPPHWDVVGERIAVAYAVGAMRRTSCGEFAITVRESESEREKLAEQTEEEKRRYRGASWSGGAGGGCISAACQTKQSENKAKTKRKQAKTSENERSDIGKTSERKERRVVGKGRPDSARSRERGADGSP